MDDVITPEQLEKCKRFAKMIPNADSLESQLKEYIEEKINKCKVCLTFDGDYLSGKIDAFNEILKKIEEMED